jgi:hypothetical protein
LFYAAMHPDTPLHMDRIGTDCVERHFSSQGSWVVNKRSYNFLQMLQMLHKMNWLGTALTEGKVRAPQVAHHNDEPWRKEGSHLSNAAGPSNSDSPFPSAFSLSHRGSTPQKSQGLRAERRMLATKPRG